MQQSEPSSERRPLLDDDALDDDDAASAFDESPDAAPPPPVSAASATTALPSDASWLQRNRWIALALGSGACAAFNAVCAKLTTTSSTSQMAARLAALLGIAAGGKPAMAFEILLRGVFFGLNLAFDAVMWTIFTQALARAASATQVTVLNTSTNFLLTGLLGLAVFAEALPPQWWVGAALLVSGTFVVGRAGEAEEKARRAAEPAAAATDADADADTPGLVPPDGILLVEPVVEAQTEEELCVAASAAVPRSSSSLGRRSPRLAARAGDAAD